MLRLYMDVHVKATITAGARRRGIDAITAQEDSSARLEDGPLLDRVTALQCVLFTQDEDLLAIAQERQVTAGYFSGLLYGHQLAATIWRYVLDLVVVCQVLEPEDMANRIEYLLLGRWDNCWNVVTRHFLPSAESHVFARRCPGGYQGRTDLCQAPRCR
jgi:hypothetical protein